MEYNWTNIDSHEKIAFCMEYSVTWMSHFYSKKYHLIYAKMLSTLWMALKFSTLFKYGSIKVLSKSQVFMVKGNEVVSKKLFS